MLETVTAKQKESDSRLSDTLESFIERIVKKMMSSPETIAQITEAIIYNPGLFAPKAFLIKFKQRNNMGRRTKSEERCRQYVKTGVRFDHNALSNPSETGDKPPTDIADSVNTSLKVYSIVTL